MTEDILAEIDATGPRRWVGIGILLILGGLLLYTAFATPPQSFLWQAFLIAMGVVSLWFAQRMQIATTRRLILTREALTDSDGTVLARVDDIESVSRGMFALKPSNGFMIKVKTPAPRAWHPGVWWRLGRRVAVGGVTSGRQTRPMADILTLLIAEKV